MVVGFIFECAESVFCSFGCKGGILTISVVLIIVKESEVFQFLFSVLEEDGFGSGVVNG